MSLPYDEEAMPFEQDSLTTRETDVMRLLANGCSSKQIAYHLNLSLHTVANHRKHICRKLGVNSTPALILCAARLFTPASCSTNELER